MTRVRIAELKARLSTYVRAAQRGAQITVLDRDTPVAQLGPVGRGSGLQVRPPLRGAPSLWQHPPAPALQLDTDIVELLLQDRRRR